MIAFPGMLAVCAEKAGIKVPEDLENYDAQKYPHWHVYLQMQLGASMPSPTSHWSNAEVVANIPDDKIQEVSAKDLFELGFAVGCSIP